MLVAYHEAGHIVVAWLLDLPIGESVVAEGGNGVTKTPWWYRATTMFRAVNQETVRKKILFSLAGDYGEQLLVLHTSRGAVSMDNFFAHYLARRFCLDLRELREEASRMVVRQRATIAAVAHELYTSGSLDGYQLALLRMDWLARGKKLELRM